MPGAAVLRHQPEHRAVFLDHVMRRNPGLGAAQPVDGGLAGLHARVMQDQHVHRRIRGALVVVGARQVDAAQRHRPRSRLIRSQAALIRATLSLALAMKAGGTPRAARLSGWFSRISRFQVLRSSSSLAARLVPSTP